MSGPRSRRRAQACLLADMTDLLRPPRRPRLPGMLWHWRYELAILTAAAFVVTVLVHTLGVECTVLVISGLVGALGPWPPWHEPFLAMAWRVVTPHRLRTGLVQARVASRQGRIPRVLRTTRTPRGEQVRLWCPAGTSAEDVRSARGILRAACWAADIEVTRDQRHAQLVTVDVIRRVVPPGPARATAAGPQSRP